jgi:hypothetical protein
MSYMSELAAEQQEMEQMQMEQDMEYMHHCIIVALQECREKGVSATSFEDLRIACGISRRELGVQEQTN